MSFPGVNEQMDVIRSGAVDVLPEDELAQKIEASIKNKEALRIKLGCDPSRPDLHIGHAVVLGKLRQFQDLGHKAILIVGDFTAMIGDPSGRSKTRPPLSLEETRINGQSYLDQATLVLARESLRTAYNSEWLNKLSFQDVISLAASSTVAQILERDDFTKRHKAGQPISLHEFLYPLAQAYDSVAIKADVELGGTDQKFNLLLGREVQKGYKVQPQCVITTPLLEGTDGVEKMSKSLDNYIGLTHSPTDMFGRTMSIPDTMISRYYQLGAFADADDVASMQQGLADGRLHPRDAKMQVARAIVARYHNPAAAEAAVEEWRRVIVAKDNAPDDVDEFVIVGAGTEYSVIDALAASGLCKSKGEARRLIQQGGLSIDGERVKDIDHKVDLRESRLFKRGKRHFLRIKGGN